MRGSGWVGVGLFTVAGEALAAGPAVGDGAGLGALIVTLPLLCLVALAAVKSALVLSALRAALGSALPPRPVVAVIAVLLALVATAPVSEQIWEQVRGGLGEREPAALATTTAKGFEPLRRFLVEHTPARERDSFLDLARRLRPPAERPQVSGSDLAVVAPAFLVAELRAAFQVAFLLLLPFLIIELVTATILAAIGLRGVEARVASLPFKLLLFVVVDGWHLVARGLVAGNG